MGTYWRVARAVRVAGMRLVVQARSWEGVCVPGRLAGAPVGAEARAHGHAWLAGLIGSHGGVRLLKRKRWDVKTTLCKPSQLYNIMHSPVRTGQITQLTMEMAAGCGRNVKYSSDWDQSIFPALQFCLDHQAPSLIDTDLINTIYPQLQHATPSFRNEWCFGGDSSNPTTFNYINDLPHSGRFGSALWVSFSCGKSEFYYEDQTETQIGAQL